MKEFKYTQKKDKIPDVKVEEKESSSKLPFTKKQKLQEKRDIESEIMEMTDGGRDNEYTPELVGLLAKLGDIEDDLKEFRK